MNAKTFPAWAQQWGLSLDALRNFLRKTPALQALGTKHGPVKIYNFEEAERIRLAFEAKRSGKAQKELATAS